MGPHAHNPQLPPPESVDPGLVVVVVVQGQLGSVDPVHRPDEGGEREGRLHLQEGDVVASPQPTKHSQ